VVYVIVSGAKPDVSFTPLLWQLIQLSMESGRMRRWRAFIRRATGITHSADEIREYASGFEEIGMYHRRKRMPLRRRKRLIVRHQRAGKKWETLPPSSSGTGIRIPYLTRLNEKMGFVYTRWFTFLTLAFFAVMTLIFVERWSEIGTDTWKYYDFTEKGLADILEFWFLFCFLGFFTKLPTASPASTSAEASTKMGFLLYYLEPCFFVDVTEVYVYAGKWERIAHFNRRHLGELIFCATATVLWWGTPSALPPTISLTKIILITGVGVAVINLNPLIKLDGYYILCELTGIIGSRKIPPLSSAVGSRRTSFDCPWRLSLCLVGGAAVRGLLFVFRVFTATPCST